MAPPYIRFPDIWYPSTTHTRPRFQAGSGLGQKDLLELGDYQS